VTVQRAQSAKEQKREKIEQCLARTGSISVCMAETHSSYETVRNVMHGQEQGVDIDARKAIKRGMSRGIWRARCVLDDWGVRRLTSIDREEAVARHLVEKHGGGE
jgi:hypothetical protein